LLAVGAYSLAVASVLLVDGDVLVGRPAHRTKCATAPSDCEAARPGGLSSHFVGASGAHADTTAPDVGVCHCGKVVQISPPEASKGGVGGTGLVLASKADHAAHVLRHRDTGKLPARSALPASMAFAARLPALSEVVSPKSASLASKTCGRHGHLALPGLLRNVHYALQAHCVLAAKQAGVTMHHMPFHVCDA